MTLPRSRKSGETWAPSKGRDVKDGAPARPFRSQKKADSSPLKRVRNDKGFWAVTAPFDFPFGSAQGFGKTGQALEAVP